MVRDWVGVLSCGEVATYSVQQLMEPHTAARQCLQVAPFPAFGECVLEPPERFAVIGELRVGRLAPFLQHVGQAGDRYDFVIDCLDQQVMDASIGNPFPFVSLGPTLLCGEEVLELANTIENELWQVTADEASMFTGQCDFTGEHQVVTDQHARPYTDPGRECFIV